MSTITPAYVDSYLYLTYPSEKDDLRPILFSKKNPFPGLIRMLGHKNNKVVCSSISSIGSIINGNIGKIQASQPHPLFESIESCDGINKIFSLFQHTNDKTIKDKAAVCLGRLFHAKEIVNQEMKIQIISHLKSILSDPDDWTSSQSFLALEYITRNKVNCSEVIRGIDLSAIIEEMKKPIMGSDEEKKLIKLRQEIYSFYLSKMIQDMEESTEFRRQAIKQGLVDLYVIIFESWELTAITRKFTDAFFELAIKDHRFVADLLSPIQRMYPGLVRLPDHEETLVIADSLCSIHNILQISSQQSQKIASHPHYSAVCAQDGIRKIFQVLKRKENNDFNLQYPYKFVTNPTHAQNKFAFDTLYCLVQMQG
ncbi:MAG: hypothetical protein EZS28_005486 [Streblomastix strix]|uniref:Uncharacterized protein n=1 Tax=Streblomastix strix TaxID=222440 RepID=A0A5J4WVA2_9EUKA|nr:MAG: hypothetical protein EZS28_005486 [Streblomastix strix]